MTREPLPVNGERSPVTAHQSPLTALLLVLLLTLPAMLPLLRPGFFVSDDGLFHLYRTAALAQAWQQGVLHPRLFPQFGFDYGQAVLNFYAPLTYWPAALLALVGFGPVAAVKLTLALSILLAGLAAYGYGRYLWGPWAGLLAAVVYTYTPYHLADAYLRGAIPEHVAFIFPPLILWANTALFRERDPWPPLLWGTLAWAGLALTHNLTALLMAPVALAHLLVMALASRPSNAQNTATPVGPSPWRRLAAGAAMLALAAGMTAAFWLPALVESRSVGLALGPSRGYENHLLSAATLVRRSLAYFANAPDALGRIYPLSWFSLALLALGLGLFLVRWARHRLPPGAASLAFHLALAAGAMFMTTTAALSVWRPLTPLLGHLQYPWRFLLLEAAGLMGVAAALPVLLPRVRPALLVALVATSAILVSMVGLRVEPLTIADAEAWSPERMWREDAAAGQVGATWTGEFLPLTVTEQRWALGRPREGATDGPALQPRPIVRLTDLGYTALSAQVDAATPMLLRLHQFHLPGWNAAVDGRPVITYPTGELGLVTVDVPAGQHEIRLWYGATPARRAGGAVSAASTVLWVALVWRRSRRHRLLAATSVAVAVLALALALNSLGVGQRRWTPQPANVAVEDVAVLLAADRRILPGQDVAEVTLYWLALRDIGENLKAFVHVLGPDGAVIAQHDGDPVGGFTPTSRWRQGEIIRDRHEVALPAGLPAGDYNLRAGLYRFETLHNLAVDPPTADSRVDIGVLTVR